MYDVLANLLFGQNIPELTNGQINIITTGAVVLVVFAFCMISLSFYKLMLYIAKF